MIAFVATLAVAAAAAQATTSWPSRSTPMHSTLGWFKATNAHNRHRLLSYVAPRARAQMGWAVPSRAWPKYTDLRCHRQRPPAYPKSVDMRCTFHESGPTAVVGTPVSFWDVTLRHTHTGWRIYDYGQG